MSLEKAIEHGKEHLDELVDKLPAMLRGVDGGKPTDEQLNNAIDVIKEAFRP